MVLQQRTPRATTVPSSIVAQNDQIGGDEVDVAEIAKGLFLFNLV